MRTASLEAFQLRSPFGGLGSTEPGYPSRLIGKTRWHETRRVRASRLFALAESTEAKTVSENLLWSARTRLADFPAHGDLTRVLSDDRPVLIGITVGYPDSI